ncbi:hypothetical protein MMX123_03119 [Microbacterium sp. MM2322]|uniref:hypothetical protein n=1 Tax=Microbacterium sp. MM2322 TaxID=3157631 RepID=UPI003D80A16C
MAKNDQGPLRVGDVFAVPMNGCGYGFGRMLFIDGKWRLAEFFAAFRAAAEYDNSIPSAGRVMAVYNIVPLRIEDGTWPIVHREPDFVPAGLGELVFHRGLASDRTFIRLNGEHVDTVTADRTPSAPTMPQFAEYITDELKRRLCAAEEFEARRATDASEGSS